MVVEEPGVEVGVAERGLNCGDVHGGDSTAARRGVEFCEAGRSGAKQLGCPKRIREVRVRIPTLLGSTMP